MSWFRFIQWSIHHGAVCYLGPPESNKRRPQVWGATALSSGPVDVCPRAPSGRIPMIRSCARSHRSRPGHGLSVASCPRRSLSTAKRQVIGLTLPGRVSDQPISVADAQISPVATSSRIESSGIHSTTRPMSQVVGSALIRCAPRPRKIMCSPSIERGVGAHVIRLWR
jgi:hypothetical protein